MKLFASTLIVIFNFGLMAYAQQSTYTLKPIIDPTLAILPMVSDVEKAWLQKVTRDAAGNLTILRKLSVSAIALVDYQSQGLQTILILKEFDEKQTEVIGVNLYRLENLDCPIISIIHVDNVRDGDGEIIETKASVRFDCKKSVANSLARGNLEITTLEDSSGNLTHELLVKHFILWNN